MSLRKPTYRRRSDLGGFTLVELLIVIAIVGILSSIGLANYLEAQTRSKVSSAKNSLRVLELGVEAYRVDNKQFPYTESYDGSYWVPPGGGPRSAPELQCGGLTSPIAYLMSLPQDPFKEKLRQTGSADGEAPEWDPVAAAAAATSGTAVENQPGESGGEGAQEGLEFEIAGAETEHEEGRKQLTFSGNGLGAAAVSLPIRQSRFSESRQQGAGSGTASTLQRQPTEKYVNYERAGFGIVNGQMYEDVSVVLTSGQYDASRFRLTPPYASVVPEIRVPDAPTDWLVYSIGPDQSYSAPAPPELLKKRVHSRYDVHNIYDPTNGTVSAGNIVRFPGGYTAPE